MSIIEGGRVVTWAPSYLALGKGYFKSAGLDVQYSTAAATTAVAAVIAGSALASFTGAPVALAAILKGSPVRIVAITSGQYGAELTASNKWMDQKHVTPQSPLEQKVQALKGAKIAIYAPGDSTDQLMRFLFKKYGINADTDVQLVSLQTNPNMLSALEHGSVDVMAASPPNGEQAEAQGIARVFMKASEIPELETYPYLVATASLKDIQSRPQLVVGVVKALARAEKDLHSDPSAAKLIVQKYFPTIDPKVFGLSYQTMLPAVPANPVPTQEQFAALQTIAKLQGKPINASFEQVMDP
ncbi:MAG: ABC transporter substrate-binding protein, partial [Chloroflexota bacterium]|nr:ABC transporter substrate-binding protein [Chloroflexota bacterium]